MRLFFMILLLFFIKPCFAIDSFEDQVKACIAFKNEIIPTLNKALSQTQNSIDQPNAIKFSKLKKAYKIFGKKIDKLQKMSEKAIDNLDPQSLALLNENELQVFTNLGQLQDHAKEIMALFNFVKAEESEIDLKETLTMILAELKDATVQFEYYDTNFSELPAILAAAKHS